MLRTFLIALFLCVSTTFVAAETSKTDQAEFKALLDRYASAWGSLNPDNAAPFYAKESDLVFYDLTPLKYSGWSEYDKGVRLVFSGFETLTMTSRDDLKVTRHGNFAWTTATVHVSMKEKSGKLMELDTRHTAIWEKRGGKWLIVHEHFSAPLPG